MDNRYLTAFLTPKKHKVAGVWLDTFCCRHMLTLEAIRSPLVARGKPVNGVDDLVNAIKICSTKDWQEAIDSSGIVNNIKFNYLFIDAEALAEGFKAFQLYITESMSAPKTWIKGADSKNIDVKNEGEGVPPSLALVVLLMTKFNFSERDAWDCPYSRAVWYATAYAAQEGADIKIITTDSEERAEEDKKLIEDIEKSARKEFGQNG